MIQTLSQFQDSTKFVYDRLNPHQRFATHHALKNKVNDRGELLPFFGDTVIFDLDDSAKKWLKTIQDFLYASCGRYTLLADRLTQESFHITLHDLASSTPDHAKEMLTDIHVRQEKANALLSEFCRQYPNGIRMKATALMNMMHTSVVLAFEPVSDEDCAILMNMYEQLQQVVRLNYGLTPHVTIAYYRPDDNGYGEDVTAALQQVIDDMNAIYHGKEIVLNINKLHYCRFTDMNHYYTKEEIVRLFV